MNTEKHIGINGLFLRKPGSGIGQVSLFFLSELQRVNLAGFRYTLYVDKEDITFSVPEGSRVVYLRPWWQRDDLIRKLLWEHIQLPKRALADKVTHFLSLYQAPTEFPKSIVHTMVVHDIIPELFPEYTATTRNRFMWNLTKRAVLRATKLVAVSQSTKNDVVKHLAVDSEKISIAYPSINPLFFAQTGQETERVLTQYQLSPGFLYHGGGLEIRKNTESLLMAYAAWKKAPGVEPVPDLVISGFVHSGDNPLATDVEGLIDQLEIKEHVRLLGFVPTEDLPALYKESALFLFPSLYEGFGMPVVEALSQGTAVLALQHSSLQEVGGESVFWTEEFTKDSLLASYQKAINSLPEEKAVRVLQAKRFSSWQQFTEKIIDTLIQ